MEMQGPEGAETTEKEILRRGVELLAELAEDRLGQDRVTPRRVQQAGGAGNGEDGGELPHHQTGQEHDVEQLPAGLQGDGAGRGGTGTCPAARLILNSERGEFTGIWDMRSERMSPRPTAQRC